MSRHLFRRRYRRPVAYQSVFVAVTLLVAATHHGFAQQEGGGGHPPVVEYFTTPGCHDCEEYLDEVVEPAVVAAGLELRVASSLDPDGFELMTARLASRGQRFTGTPVTIAGARAFQGFADENELRAAIATLANAAGPEPGTAGGPVPESEPIAAVESSVGPVQTFGVGAVFLAGLADGVNPCAFSVIAFLVSSLALGGRKPRTVAIVGLSFAAGVFLTYTALGIGALSALRALSGFAVVGQIIRVVSLVLVSVFGLLSLRDAYLLAHGRTEAVVLRMPDRLKERAHNAVRGARRLGFAGASSFLLGGAVSLFEVVCTGQVYLPTLTYLAQQGSAAGAMQLLLYNFAFILPLLLVLGAAWAGVGSKRIADWIGRHMVAGKLALAGAFVVLSILLAAGS